jgi:hypothetical protein
MNAECDLGVRLASRPFVCFGVACAAALGDKDDSSRERCYTLNVMMVGPGIGQRKGYSPLISSLSKASLNGILGLR